MANPTPTYYEEVQRGDDRPLRFPVTSDDDGAALDVSGWPVRARLWRSQHPGAPLLHTWTSGAGSAAAEGGHVLLLTDESRDWDWERGVAEVELTHPSGATTIEAVVTVVLTGWRT